MSPKKEQNSQKEVKKTEIHPKKGIVRKKINRKKKILMVHLNLIEFGKKNRKQRRMEKKINPV